MVSGWAPVLLAALFALAGCAEPPAAESGEEDEEVVVVTGPDDYSYLQNGTSQGAHLHDYWGGQDRLTVLDLDSDDLPVGFAGDPSTFPVHSYQPPSDRVVPQGALYVDVTLSWEDGPTDVYDSPSLWVKTANETEAHFVSGIESGQTVRLTLNETDWDLPHQILSAWEFQLRVEADPTLGFARFQATGHAVVEVERGLPIPIYPAHPDHWQNATEIPLVDVSGSVAYLHDPGNGGCDGFACQEEHRPPNGTIVPPDTDHVQVVLTLDQGAPLELGLQYHGADRRDFLRPEPTERDRTRLVYDLPVDGDGDGPYAEASLWSFMVYDSGPIGDTGGFDTYTLTATAHHA